MTRSLWLAAIVALLLIAAPMARADISAAAPAISGHQAQAAAERGVSQGEGPSTSSAAGGDGILATGLGVQDALAVPVGDAADSAKPLPPEPGSKGLFLSALISLGAWQLGRATRNIHLFHVPDWYHAEGPAQVGHTFAANPECSGMQAVCLFEDTEEASPVLLCAGRCDAPPVPLTLCLLTSESPRGPPLFLLA